MARAAGATLSSGAPARGTFSRRLSLWRILSATADGFTLRVLAERLDVSKNTVMRDLDALSSAGVPVAEERRGQTSYFSVAGAPAVTGEAVGRKLR
jgi:DNA-binding transcriptional ArsR family regulator